jgi:hypothetical protein
LKELQIGAVRDYSALINSAASLLYSALNLLDAANDAAMVSMLTPASKALHQ